MTKLQNISGIGVLVFIVGIIIMLVTPLSSLKIFGIGFLLIILGFGMCFAVWFYNNTIKINRWLDRQNER